MVATAGVYEPVNHTNELFPDPHVPTLPRSEVDVMQNGVGVQPDFVDGAMTSAMFLCGKIAGTVMECFGFTGISEAQKEAE